jgi:hypothetical protein
MFNTREKRMLRNVYGSVTPHGAWRIRICEEVMELYKTPDLVTDSKSEKVGVIGAYSQNESNEDC